MTRRPAALVVALCGALSLALAGCGGGDGDEGRAEPTTTTGVPTTTTTSGTPITLGSIPSLELEPGQCYAAAPAPDPTTTTTAPTEVTAAPVLEVDCAGAHDARVYAAYCLAASAEGPLTAGTCPGRPDLPWPGARELRRTAVRLCLDRFAEEFGEPYATSERTTVELTPTQEVWAAGHRRVVCAVEA